MSSIERPASPWRPSRREILCVGIGGVVAAVPFARRQALALVRRNVLTMGTIAEFAVAHRDPRQAETAIDRAVEALHGVDRAMSSFTPASDVGRANLRAVDGPVDVSAGTMDVLGESLRWAETSRGVFDPCLWRATSAWDVTHRHEPPAASTVARFANRQLYRFLEIAEQHGRPVVLFHDREVGIDLGGIAKGYGVDRAVAALREHGIEHALVGAGGDLYALGRSPAGEPWQIGIQSPDRADTLAATLPLENAAVATSGDYRQFFEYRHRRYHHLLDPATGEPRRTAQHSISVVAPSCMAADAGATTAFGLPRADAERVLARHGARIAHAI